jgi:two-component system invasion response regulator UvrY
MIANNRSTIVRLCNCRVCGEGFLAHCQNEPDLDAVFILDDTPHLLEDLEQAGPDVLVMDVAVRGGGFEIAAQVNQTLVSTKLVFVAKSASDMSVKQAILLGARGFVLTHEPGSVLVEHVKRVAAGGHGFSDEIALRLAFDSLRREYQLTTGTPIDTLTEIQLEIFRHLARGDSLKMVARKMNLTRKSVDGHKYRIMKKIGVQDRVLLSRLAIREGLIEA